MKNLNQYLFSCLSLMLLFTSCDKEQGFKSLPSSKTGVDFNNHIPDDKTINILNFEYLYNGGGVGVADFNKDDQLDLYFTGNMVENRLYLNQGGFNFKDITSISSTGAKGKWSNGVSIVDINGDTWPDIYVCVSSLSFGAQPKNLLLINQGNNAQGIPTFTEEAAKYGLASAKHSRHAAFFDYDRDGDLDVYILNNIIDLTDPTAYRRKNTNGTATNNDQLFQNIGNQQFKEVTREAGIRFEGYGLGLAIADLNQDGWQDIYVANDYISNDLMYINQQDGTFKNEIGSRTKLQSKFSMGVTVSDFNNDGASDILVLDMLSATNNRLKRHVKESNYNNRKNNEFYHYQEQVPRNTFQLNHGNGHFGEVALYSGIYASDWSWSPLTADFNNDGLLDVYITNGFPKDITELDFVDYRAGANLALNKKRIFEKLIEEKVPNCLFINEGALQFKEQAKTWQLDKPSYSNGAVYADFDNDGQLDIIVNNINESAYILKNNGFSNQNYLQIQFPEKERYNHAIGAKVIIYANGKQQFQEYHLHKSYLSSYSPFLHFGLGQAKKVDSLVVQWPDWHKQTFRDIATNQVFTIKRGEGKVSKIDYALNYRPLKEGFNPFQMDTLTLSSKSSSQNDFSYQRTLPFSYSHLGPVIAVGDLNNDKESEIVSIDGSEDFIKIYYPKTEQIDTIKGMINKGVNGLLIVDLDQDGWQDIAVTYGGYDLNEPKIPDTQFHFELFLNKGDLHFESYEKIMFSSTDNPSLGVIRGSDFDQDGDIDLFLGGTVRQNNYPIASNSYLWINNIGNEDDDGIDLGNLGIVMDALWTDINGDGQKELMIAAHLKPIQILSFDAGKLVVSDQSSVTKTGFWNSILPLDYDRDGDIDYVLGNLGTNTPLSNGDTPISIIYHDQDNNGSIDGFIGFYFNNEGKEVPFEFRNEVIAQLPNLKKQFTDYKTYAGLSFDTFLEIQESADIKKIVIQQVKHQLLENQEGTFLLKDLPLMAQLSPIYGMTNADFDQDNLPDIIGATNLSASREFWGTYSALNGLFLSNSTEEAGFSFRQDMPRIEGDSRSILTLNIGDFITHHITRVDDVMITLSALCDKCFFYNAQRDEMYALISFKDGTSRKEEFYYGSGFRSQHHYGFWLSDITKVERIQIKTHKGFRELDL